MSLGVLYIFSLWFSWIYSLQLFSPSLEFFFTSSWHGKRFNFDKILVFHLWIMLLILCVKISHQIQCANDIFIYFLLKALQFYILHLNILAILSFLLNNSKLIRIWHTYICITLMYNMCLIVPLPFVENTISPPFNWFCIFSKNQLAIVE